MTLCSDKARLPDAATARKVLVRRIGQNMRRGKQIPGRFYHCQICDGWHLTSRPPHGRWYDAAEHAGVYTLVTWPGHE